MEEAHGGVRAVAASATPLQRAEYVCAEGGQELLGTKIWPVFDEAPADKYMMPLALEQRFFCSSALLLTALILV